MKIAQDINTLGFYTSLTAHLCSPTVATMRDKKFVPCHQHDQNYGTILNYGIYSSAGTHTAINEE